MREVDCEGVCEDEEDVEDEGCELVCEVGGHSSLMVHCCVIGLRVGVVSE